MIIRKEWISKANLKISSKLNPLYIGPFEIRKKISASTYVIKMRGHHRRYRIYNIRNLQPYIRRKQGFLVGSLRNKKGNNQSNDITDVDLNKESYETCGVIYCMINT